MATPNPFTIDREHWALINDFIGFKAMEDGVTDLTEQVDLMRQYWLLLVDKAALKTEVEAMELEKLEAAVINTKQNVIDQEQEIADRKAGRPPPRIKPEVVEPEEPVIDPTTNEGLASIRAAHEAIREAEEAAAAEEAEAAEARRLAETGSTEIFPPNGGSPE